MTNATASKPSQSPRSQAAARVRTENPIDLFQAASLFPRGERWQSLSVDSFIRWIVRGRKGVRLDACRREGKWHTSAAAIARFIAAIDAGEKQPQRPAAELSA